MEEEEVLVADELTACCAFHIRMEHVQEYFEVTEPEKIEQFDIPYSAIAMDIKLSTGKPIVVQGIVNPDLVKSYQALVNILK